MGAAHHGARTCDRPHLAGHVPPQVISPSPPLARRRNSLPICAPARFLPAEPENTPTPGRPLHIASPISPRVPESNARRSSSASDRHPPRQVGLALRAGRAQLGLRLPAFPYSTSRHPIPASVRAAHSPRNCSNISRAAARSGRSRRTVSNCSIASALVAGSSANARPRLKRASQNSGASATAAR